MVAIPHHASHPMGVAKQVGVVSSGDVNRRVNPLPFCIGGSRVAANLVKPDQHLVRLPQPDRVGSSEQHSERPDEAADDSASLPQDSGTHPAGDDHVTPQRNDGIADGDDQSSDGGVAENQRQVRRFSIQGLRR